MLLLKKYCSDESGATAIEYGLIATLIALAIVGGATLLGQETGRLYNEAGAAF